MTTVNGKILEPITNTDGYLQCKLCSNGTHITVRVHRLVAEHFIPNPENLPEVNHIDYDRKNNIVANLEWSTHIDNVRHSSKIGKYKRYGESNSNYGGTKLKDFYRDNPEARMLLGRKGAQNGRCVPIRMHLSEDEFIDFNYIGECAQYLIDNQIVKATVNSARSHIAQAIKKNRKYHKIKFIHLPKNEDNTVPSLGSDS